jgi:hypothetical protein
VITSGSRQQSIGLVIKTGAGTRGVATYAAYIDGGTTPFQTGTTASSVVLTAIGLTISMPAGTYSADNVYTGVVESWTNQTPKTRLLVAPGIDSAKPTLTWHAQNNLPTIHSAGGSTGYMHDSSSDWAAQVASGTDSDFSVFLMANTDAPTPVGIEAWLCFGHSVDPDPYWIFAARNSTNLHRTEKKDDGGSAATADGSALDSNYHVFSIIQHGTTVDFRKDGSAIYTGTAQDVGVTTLDCVALFAILRATAATNTMAGAIGELITYNAALSAPDALTVEQYMRTGWNI